MAQFDPRKRAAGAFHLPQTLWRLTAAAGVFGIGWALYLRDDFQTSGQFAIAIGVGAALAIAGAVKMRG